MLTQLKHRSRICGVLAAVSKRSERVVAYCTLMLTSCHQSISKSLLVILSSNLSLLSSSGHLMTFSLFDVLIGVSQQQACPLSSCKDDLSLVQMDDEVRFISSSVK